MRPLNRPMFKMGGPVKEGIMDGIKEPQATFGVGNNANRDPKTGREKHAVFLAAGIPAALTAARVAIPAALRAFGPAAVRGFQAARTFQPGKLGVLGRTKDIFSVRGGLSAPMAGSRAEGLGFRVGSFARQNPFLTLSTPSLATTAVTAGGPAVLGAGKAIANFLVPGERFDPFKPEKPEEIVKKSEVGQVGKKGADTKVEKTGTNANQFDDDGTKKSTSVDRLLKGIVKRARVTAGADTAIEAGRQLRTGEMSIKDPTKVIDIASEKFDKVSDIQSKVDLARIENELKKQQIAAQATATTEKALEIERRKRSMITMGDLVRADKSGMGLTHSGTLGIAREFADLTGKKYRGSIGNDDLLAQFEKNDRFKTDELGVITEKLQGGDDGLYILGTRVYEKSGPIVKLIKT